MPPLARLPALDPRIPAWDQGDLVERPCPLCNSDGSAICERPDGLMVKSCPTCGTYYVSPAPSQRQLDRFYASYDQQHRPAATMDGTTLLRRYRSQAATADMKIRELSSLLALRGARTLDIGFGRARFMYDLSRLGADVYGIEVDAAAVRLAASIGLENTSQSTIEEFTGGGFDLVSMNDVLEHSLDPVALASEAASRLAPGGLLSVWTPNGDSSRRDPSKTTFRVDLEHLQYLTPQGVGLLAGRLGLVVVHLETVGYPELGQFRPAAAGSTLRGTLKARIRTAPGYRLASRLLQRKALTSREPRLGDYHLFSILRAA